MSVLQERPAAEALKRGHGESPGCAQQKRKRAQAQPLRAGRQRDNARTTETVMQELPIAIEQGPHQANTEQQHRGPAQDVAQAATREGKLRPLAASTSCRRQVCIASVWP